MKMIIRGKKNRFFNIAVILFFIIFLLAAKNVLATELNLKPSTQQVSSGDTVSVDVMINTEGESVNVVEGNINVSAGLDLVEIKELSSADSILSQWVRNPSWSEKDGIISFVGGRIGGFNQKSATLFKIFFTAKSAGQVTFSLTDIKAYANDGLATRVGVHVTPLSVNISPKDNLPIRDELNSLIIGDFRAPIDINIDLGRDSSLFDGQRFINISALDSESGMAYFEVKEGNREPVRTTGSYVLQNQNELEPIIIFAFDKAGNISKKVLTPHITNTNNYLAITIYSVILLAILVAIFSLYRIFRKRKKKN